MYKEHLYLINRQRKHSIIKEFLWFLVVLLKSTNRYIRHLLARSLQGKKVRRLQLLPFKETLFNFFDASPLFEVSLVIKIGK